MFTINGSSFTITRNIDGSAYDPIRTTDNCNVTCVSEPSPVISPNSVHISTKTLGATTTLNFGDTTLQLIGGLSGNVGINFNTFHAIDLPINQTYLFTVMWKFDNSPGDYSGEGFKLNSGIDVNLLTSSIGTIDSFNTFGGVFDSGNNYYQYSRFVKPNESGVINFTIDDLGTYTNSTDFGCDIWLIYLDPIITT